MRAVRVSALGAAFVVGCSGGAGPAPVISVGGTYDTAVTLVSSSCAGQTVEQHQTLVGHSPGATALTLTHAGSAYGGTLSSDGSFATATVGQVFDNISYRIGIVGRFTQTAIDATVTVSADRQPPCTFTARWAGPKVGAPNVLP